MPHDPTLKAKELGIPWPAASKAVAAYVPGVLVGESIFISGQLPMRNGELLASGAVPTAAALEKAKEAAGQCAVNALAVVGDLLGGDWDRLVRIVRLGVFVYSDAGFHDQHLVANGASEMLQALLGEQGRHARAAVGVSALPLGASVEAELTVAVRGKAEG